MAILINNGVQNILGTPGAISGVFSDRPAAPDLAEGTLYFSTDTTTIYQVSAGAWIVYAGGGGGGVSAVTGTKPISSTGGATPDISISQATALTDGYLNFQDWNTFNNKLNGVTASLPLSSTGGSDPVLSISQSGLVTDGYLNSTDWNTFNDKIGGGGVSTRVAFFTAGKVITGSPQFIWDFANNRLGVGGSPFGYKLSVLDPNFYARFGTTAGSDANAITFGKSTSSALALFGPAAERKILIGNGTTGFADFVAYSDNVIRFSYSNATGGAQLSPYLTFFTGNFFYSAGTNSHTQIYLQPSIQTSGGTNLLRGIYYAPIKTTDTGTTQIAWENTEGDIIFGNLASNPGSITFVDNVGKLGISYLKNDTALNKIYTVFAGGNTNGLSLDVNSSIYEFGIFGGDWYLRINSNTILLNGDSCGFQANGGASVIGDVSNYNNQSYFGVDDLAQKLIASGNLISTIGGTSTDRIKITVGGNDYLIVLEKA